MLHPTAMLLAPRLPKNSAVSFSNSSSVTDVARGWLILGVLSALLLPIVCPCWSALFPHYRPP